MTPNIRKRGATFGASERRSRRLSGVDPGFCEETVSPRPPATKMSRNSAGKFVRSEGTPPQEDSPSPSKPSSPRHQKPSLAAKRHGAPMSSGERPPRCQVVEVEAPTPSRPQSPKDQDFLTPRLPIHAKCSQPTEGETPSSETPRRGRGRPPKSLSRPTIVADTGKPPSPIKTRRIKAVSSAPHCTLCKKPKKDSLKPCSKCNLNYHLSACLKYKESVAEIAAEKEDWLCPKCIRCSACSEFIEDAHNKECVQCLRAWHGRCFKGHSSEEGDCCKRCNVNRSTSRVAFLEPSTSTAPATPPSKNRGRPPKGVRLFPSEKTIMASQNRFKYSSVTSEDTERLLTARAAIWDSHVDEFEEAREQQAASPSKATKSKKQKRPVPLSTDDDLNLFDEVLQQWWDERKEQKKKEEEIPKQTKDKWVYMGRARKMKALYDSPFPEDVLASEHIYICPFCLTATGDADCYRIHRNMCTWRHPPGNEIYRDDGLSFFEVDGALHATYCRNLCLLSKMFISSKTLHHEVATFRFYILTEHTPDGCCLVGYFSKEDKPSRNNNLSCLLTLPGQSRRGYGKLLIELSYELSRREVKIGCPEHPLSDLGLYAYRGYWRSRIVQYLRSARNASQTSIKQMALDTRISPTDIVNQLMLDELLVCTDGNYFIKTGKRAFKFPLSTIRRRVIDQKKLIWTPPVDVSHLDPTKLNYYA